jgi:hypothetical protein
MPKPYSAETAEAVIANTPSAFASLKTGADAGAMLVSITTSLPLFLLGAQPAAFINHYHALGRNSQPTSTALPSMASVKIGDDRKT